MQICQPTAKKAELYAFSAIVCSYAFPSRLYPLVGHGTMLPEWETQQLESSKKYIFFTSYTWILTIF